MGWREYRVWQGLAPAEIRKPGARLTTEVERGSQRDRRPAESLRLRRPSQVRTHAMMGPRSRQRDRRGLRNLIPLQRRGTGGSVARPARTPCEQGPMWPPLRWPVPRLASGHRMIQDRALPILRAWPQPGDHGHLPDRSRFSKEGREHDSQDDGGHGRRAIVSSGERRANCEPPAATTEAASEPRREFDPPIPQAAPEAAPGENCPMQGLIAGYPFGRWGNWPRAQERELAIDRVLPSSHEWDELASMSSLQIRSKSRQFIV